MAIHIKLNLICLLFLAGCSATQKNNEKINPVKSTPIQSEITVQSKEKPNQMPTKEFTKNLFFEISLFEPRGDKYMSDAELSVLTKEHLKKYNNYQYTASIKLSDYNRERQDFFIYIPYTSHETIQNEYTATNAYGASVQVIEVFRLEDNLSFDKSWLKVSSDIARKIDGKVGVLTFKNIKDDEDSHGNKICGVMKFEADFDSPLAVTRSGCELVAEVISFTIDGIEYKLQ